MFSFTDEKGKLIILTQAGSKMKAKSSVHEFKFCIILQFYSRF